jgi:metallo-beta-lactamase family protein
VAGAVGEEVGVVRVKIHFLGANRQVSGSRYGLENDRTRILIDCGMFQERAFQSRNWEDGPVTAATVQAVVLTHAHIDHCGLLPRLVKQGFSGPIFATTPTVDLADIMLRDAAKIQLEDVKYKQKRHAREGRVGRHAYTPLYDENDVLKTLALFQGVSYHQAVDVADGISVTFHDAGHILGSASLEVLVPAEHGSLRRIVFSGDIGQWGKPLIRDPTVFAEADYVVIESTYGDRLHPDQGDIETQLQTVINQTAVRGGKVIIPTFALERAQELMYFLGRLAHTDRIPDIPVFLDSPMACDVTEVFQRHRQSYDTETWELIGAGLPPLDFPGLSLCRTTAESKRINRVAGPAIIMSTSGMCTAGRIKHHLRNHIDDPQATILFVGYQGVGTLGRYILDKAEQVRIHGRHYPVRAQVAEIFGFSGHADRAALLRWADAFTATPRQVFVTHGEEHQALSLAARLRERNWQVSVPEYRDVQELS